MSESTQNQKRPAPYPLVIKDVRQWPIYQLSRKKKELIEAVIDESMQRLYDSEMGKTISLVADAYYQEIKRIKEEPWKVDPPDDASFFRNLKKEMQEIASGSGVDPEEERRLLKLLVTRYVNEIVGDFRLGTYKFARGMVNFGFSRVFNTFSKGLFRSISHQQEQLISKMHITGAVEEIRNLTLKGTVILVPTHFSNLDSIVIGWALQTMGLPAFTYGAGINLFGHPALSFFMNRLGAFRVDRRKKSTVYLEVLKTYTEYVIREGASTLFFPGGTRSRSGSIESRLKLGLLGTAIEAQRKLILSQPEKPQKIFVVPLVMSYHNVIEAQGLVNQYLSKEGKGKYALVKDDFSSIRKTVKFLLNFARSSSEMVFSFGKPMDLFGNQVDQDGNSLDNNGNQIEIRDYYKTREMITLDKQRSAAYTRLLGDAILKQYYKINVVFDSHLVAFASFEYIFQTEGVDIYRLFTRPGDGLSIPKDKFYTAVGNVLDQLRDLASRDQVVLADHLNQGIDKIIENGIRNLAGYHLQKPLTQNENGDFMTEDLKLLYFYHNRLIGYGLNKFIF